MASFKSILETLAAAAQPASANRPIHCAPAGKHIPLHLSARRSAPAPGELAHALREGVEVGLVCEQSGGAASAAPIQGAPAVHIIINPNSACAKW